MTRRDVTYTEGNAGIWNIYCADCPMLQHLKACDLKPMECAGGIATNMQGPIVMRTCKHTKTDTLKDAEGQLSIECNYAA